MLLHRPFVRVLPLARPRTRMSMSDSPGSVAWRLPLHTWVQGRPIQQPYYVYSIEESKWRGILPGQIPATASSMLDALSILSWNIDFRIPLAQPRMEAALAFLQSRVEQSRSPCIVMLQEMVNSDLMLIQEQDWVRSGYYLTDISDQFWKSNHYGTCTLISKSLPITSVFRVHYENTMMDRDGLFVDLVTREEHVLRICNTHLESLIAKPPRRPSQLHTSAKFMHESKVHASVLGGDLNAIEEFDKTMHLENDLQDAYLVDGGKEDHESGYTWGHMAKTREREQFGLSRMDKLLFCGNIELISFERFGYDVQVVAERDRQILIEEGLEKGWVTDHLGLQGTFRVRMEG